jgi:hypothetical protein
MPVSSVLSHELGIAVIHVAMKDGVKPGMPFEIFREDKPIAKVLITEVRNSVAGAIVQELAKPAIPSAWAIVAAQIPHSNLSKAPKQPPHGYVSRSFAPLNTPRISSQKARQVTRAITGMPVSQALSVLDFTPKKAAFLVGKALRSAIANAENNHEMDASANDRHQRHRHAGSVP